MMTVEEKGKAMVAIYFETLPMPQRTLPLELVHKIIIYVVADSLHLVCTAAHPTSVLPGVADPGNVSDNHWDIHVLTTLSAVCWRFRDICTDIASKAFMKDAEEELGDKSPIPVVAQKLATLRQTSHNLYNPPSDTPLNLKIKVDEVPVLGAYALYISVRYLFNSSLLTPVSVFITGATCVNTTFLAFRSLHACVKPRDMGHLLDGAINELHILSGWSLQLVQLAMTLERGLGLLGDPRLTKEYRVELIETLREGVKAIQLGNEQYTATMTANTYGGLVTRVAAGDLPGVLPTLTRLVETPLLNEDCVPESELKVTVVSMLARWTEEKLLRDKEASRTARREEEEAPEDVRVEVGRITEDGGVEIASVE